MWTSPPIRQRRSLRWAGSRWARQAASPGRCWRSLDSASCPWAVRPDRVSRYYPAPHPAASSRGHEGSRGAEKGALEVRTRETAIIDCVRVELLAALEARHTSRLRSPCLSGTGRGRSICSTTRLSSRSTRAAMGTVLRGTAAPLCCGCRQGWHPRKVSGTRSDTPPARRVLARSDSTTRNLWPPKRTILQGRRQWRLTASAASARRFARVRQPNLLCGFKNGSNRLLALFGLSQ